MIPSGQPRPGIAAKTGSWTGISQVPESKGVFIHGKTTPGYLSIWEPNSRGHLVPLTPLTCSRISSWRIHIDLPRNVLEAAAFQVGVEEGKPLGMGHTPRGLLQSSSEHCAISCLRLQHSKNILKDKSHTSHNSLFYWDFTRQRNLVWRNLNFSEILQETSILWQ